MTTQVQVRGASQATQEARTLVSRELDVNTTDNRLCVHNGSRAGGIPHVNYTDAQNQEFTYAAGSGTNAITASLAIAPASYQAGQKFSIKIANTNSGSATLNINSLGAKTIKTVKSGVLTTLTGGELVQNSIVDFVYDGTDMQFASSSASLTTTSSTWASGSPSSIAFGAGTFKTGKNYKIYIRQDTDDVITVQLRETGVGLLTGAAYDCVQTTWASDGTSTTNNSNNQTSISLPTVHAIEITLNHPYDTYYYATLGYTGDGGTNGVNDKTRRVSGGAIYLSGGAISIDGITFASLTGNGKITIVEY